MNREGARSKLEAICQVMSLRPAAGGAGGDAEDVINGFFDLLIGDGKADGAMALGVHIDEECSLAQIGHAGCQVDGAGSLAAAAFLVDQRDGSHGREHPCLGTSSRVNSRASCLALIREHFDRPLLNSDGKWHEGSCNSCISLIGKGRVNA